VINIAYHYIHVSDETLYSCFLRTMWNKKETEWERERERERERETEIENREERERERDLKRRQRQSLQPRLHISILSAVCNRRRRRAIANRRSINCLPSSCRRVLAAADITICTSIEGISRARGWQTRGILNEPGNLTSRPRQFGYPFMNIASSSA